MKTTFIFASLIVGFIFITQSLVAHALQAQPITSTSWYVSVTSSETDSTLNNWMYNAGFAEGQKAVSATGLYSYLVLDFGQPWALSATTAGTWSPNAGTGRFISTSTIRLAADWFAYGYTMGVWNGGNSVTTSQMYMIVGTNNYKDSTGYVTSTAGKSWSYMIQDIGTDLQGYGYVQTHVYGGTDSELAWSGTTTAKAWVNGYNSVWKSPYYYFDYGDANGCPQSGTTRTPAACYTGWNQDDVNYVAYEAGAYPLPEIYSTSGGNANQWQQLSLYQYWKHGYSELITGPFTQYQACQQKGGCTGTDNTPAAGWSQLWNALNSSTSTAQNLYFLTDIKWKS